MNNKNSIHIALADDHRLVRESLAQLLNEVDGFAVVAQASDGHELLCKVGNLSVLPDVCILDMNMPGGGGHAAIQELKARWPQMKFIVLSMLGHTITVLKMYRAGASGYLTKDQEPEKLFGAIRTVAEGGFYFLKEMSSGIMRSLQSETAAKEMTLTARQEEFLTLLCTDVPYKIIASKMGVGESTLNGYRATLFERFKVNSSLGLAFVAMELGLVNIGRD